MPRAGGESDKLGNRYEGLWTVHNLLDVLDGEAIALEPEPFVESKGIEFVKTLRDGTKEFHSAKRQRAGEGWRLAHLAQRDENGRSPLADLFEKLESDPSRTVVFVSATVHAQAWEVWDRSRRCRTAEEFENQLRTNKALDEDFRKYVLPMCNDDLHVAFQRFRSLRLVSQDELELRRQLEISVRRLLYRVDGGPVDAIGVVLHLADCVLNSLGRRLVQADVQDELELLGYYLRDWARETHVIERVEKLNSNYLRHVQADWILGRPIVRSECVTIIEGLLEANGKLAQLVVGTAGMGKSCVLAQAVRQLADDGVPYIVVRLDNVPVAGSTKALGGALDLPDSPAVVLAGISQGRRAILVVDQLDAMSLVSGRKTELWEVFDELVAEVRQHPNLRLLLACRAFDLDNDPRLAGLVKPAGLAHRMELGLLSLDEVRISVQDGGGSPGKLSNRELELLRTPFNLHLFLKGEPGNPIPFRNRLELFARFWGTKRQKVAQVNADFDRVVGILSDALSSAETTSLPEDRLDSVARDAGILASENVLVLENGRYRFFHEAFFDYAFARRFVRGGRDLTIFLTEECTEQQLFRRAQVRQILAYQRDDNRDNYLAAVRSLLNHPRVRLHIKTLAMNWLAQLEDPIHEEWAIVEPLIHHPQLQWAACNLLGRTLPWFDLLNQLGVLSRLLDGSEVELVDRCFYGICSGVLLSRRSVEVAALLHPYRACDGLWMRRFQELLRAGEIHHSREMFDLALSLIDAGLFDDADDLIWHALTRLAENRAPWAVEFLQDVLERLIRQANARGESSPFEDRQHRRQILAQFIQTAAKNAPTEFAEQIVPIIQRLVHSSHKAFGYIISGGLEYDTPRALLGSARRSVASVARSDPQRCDALFNGWESTNHKALQVLRISAWEANPAYFAEMAAAFLIASPSTLDLAFDCAIGADPPDLSVILPLLKAISLHVTDGTFSKLESVICRYVTEYEKKHPAYRATRELSLWQQLQSIGSAKQRNSELRNCTGHSLRVRPPPSRRGWQVNGAREVLSRRRYPSTPFPR
jgi:hypothetical protein